MIKINYTTNENRSEIIASMTGKILVGDSIHTDEKYLLFISTEETAPYVLEPTPTEPTPLELLQEDNAGLWYESMIQSTRVEANETEVASLWYELMMGGI